MSFAPGVDKKLGCLTPSKPIAPYAKSCTTKTLCFLATSTVSSKKSSKRLLLLGYSDNLKTSSSPDPTLPRSTSYNQAKIHSPLTMQRMKHQHLQMRLMINSRHKPDLVEIQYHMD